MSAQALIDDLKSRINPLYADQRGTESYERRQCAESLEKMLAENARLSALADRWNAECDAMREDNKRLAAELATAQEWNERYAIELRELREQVPCTSCKAIGAAYSIGKESAQSVMSDCDHDCNQGRDCTCQKGGQ